MAELGGNDKGWPEKWIRESIRRNGNRGMIWGSQRGVGKRAPSDSLAALVPPDGEHILEKKTPMPKDRRLRENGARWEKRGGEEGVLPLKKISGEEWRRGGERWGMGKGGRERRRPAAGEDKRRGMAEGGERREMGKGGRGRRSPTAEEDKRRGMAARGERRGREKSDIRKHKIWRRSLLVWDGKYRAIRVRSGMD